MKVVMLPELDGTGLLFRPFLQACPLSMEPLVLPLPDDASLTYEELERYIRPMLPVNSSYLLLGENLQGSQDRLVRQVAFKKLKTVKPAVNCRTITAPHLVLQVAPEQSWKHIESFSRRIHGAN